MGLKELTIFKYIVTGSGQDKGVIVLRLDKYLKLLAYYKKRRTVANEACDGGRVSVNGKHG